MRLRKRYRPLLSAAAAAAAVIGMLGFPLPAAAAPGDSPSPSGTPTAPSTSPTAGPTGPSTVPSESPTGESPDAGQPDSEEPEPVVDTGYVQIDSVTPKLTPNGTLTVKGHIVNGSDAPLKGASLKLEYQRDPLSSRDQLQSWASHPQSGLVAAELSSNPGSASGTETGTKTSAGTGRDGATKKTPQIPRSIAPGESADFTFHVDASTLDFDSAEPDRDWGVRGIAVDMIADDGTASGLRTSAPSFVTWYPNPHLKPSHLATLIPISGPRATDDEGLATSDDLEKAVSDDGRLTALLNGAGDPAISWAVDPGLIESIKDQLHPNSDSDDTGTASPTPTPTPTETPSTNTELADWYRQFTAEGQRRSVLALPWADPDLQALTKSRLRNLLGPAKKKSRLVSDVFPRAITSTAWPLFDTAHTSSLRAIKKAGYRNVVLSSTQQKFAVGYTPTARGKLSKSQSGLGTVTADATLSKLLAGLGRTGPDLGHESDSNDSNSSDSASNDPANLSPVSKGQDIARIIAETATITHERPSIPRTVLMAAPRNFTPDGESLQGLFDKLDKVPWMTTTSLSKLMKEEPSGDSTFSDKDAGGALNATVLNTLVEPRRKFDAFSGILTKPIEARDHLDRELVSLASAKWRGAPHWKSTVQDVVDRIHSDIESISVVKGSPVLLVTGDKAKLAVQVQNDFDKAAHVVVRMNPETPQLRGGVSKPVTIPPHRGSRVEVPVKGLANADVQVEVSVETTAGHQVGESTTRTVRVRADWENIGTAIIGAIVAVIFIFGIIRTFRRGRVKVTGDDLAAAETEVNSRLETGEMPLIPSDHEPDSRPRHGPDKRGKHE